MPSLDTLARQRLVMDYRPRVIAKPVRRSSDDAAERLYRAMLADLRSEIEIERADRYNIRTPAGMRAGKSRGGQFRSLSSAVIGALEAWINGEGDDDPLESFTDDQLRKAARQLDVEVPRGTSRARLKLALLQKARDDVRAQRREANDARQAMPEGYRVERLEGGRWSVQREGEPGFAEADTIAEARRLAEADRDRRTAQATRKRLEELRLPGGPAPAPRPRREQTFRPAPDTPTRRPAVPASERASRDEVMRRIQQAMDDPQMRSRLADMVAAGTVSWDSALEMLTGRADPAATDPGRMAPETTLPFVHGMVHAGYVTELAWTGDRSRVERYLRRQNTSTLHTIAPFFGVNLPGDATHSRAVAEIADQAMRLEAPRGPEVPVLSGEELRQSLMSRKVKDLQASLRAAGLPVSGRKAELVDRLMAAYGAVRGDRDDAADRADRARPAGRRDGRGRSRGAAAAQPADSEPDAPTAGPVAAGVGGGDAAGDLTGASGLSDDPAVRQVQIENRIRQAYRDLPKAPGGWVGLADLREYWQGWDHSRADFDAAIRRLARDPDWRAVPVDNRKALTERDRASAVRVGEDDVHVIAYAPGGRPAAAVELRPLSDTSLAQPARAASALPSASPGRVSVSDSRDWTPAQHVAHAEQARQAGDEAEARLHRSLAGRKNRQIVESGRGVEHLRSLADRDDARRFLRSLTRDQLNNLAAQLGVDTAGSRDAVIDRILAQLFGG